MAFNLRSGNKSSFKNIGSSPAKETSSMSASTKKKKFYVDNYEKNKDKPGFQEAMNKAFGGETTMDGMISTTTKKTPAKQKLNKGGEGQDQNKIFNERGEHVGDWIDGKKVMKHTKDMSKKLSDLTPAEKKAMKLDETYPKKSPAKQKADTTKTYPKSYTKKDIEFLKEQREDVVRYEDLDAKGKAIWKKQGKPVPKKKK